MKSGKSVGYQVDDDVRRGVAKHQGVTGNSIFQVRRQERQVYQDRRRRRLEGDACRVCIIDVEPQKYRLGALQALLDMGVVLAFSRESEKPVEFLRDFRGKDRDLAGLAARSANPASKVALTIEDDLRFVRRLGGREPLGETLLQAQIAGDAFFEVLHD